MSKIICEVCGTSYPESATQCPICGCVRPADSIAVPDSEQESGGYTHVKGGRFSKSNVKKRNKAKPSSRKEPGKPANKKIIGLAIVLFILLAIVILMCVFILQSFGDRIFNFNHDSSETSQTNTLEVPEEIPCTELKLSRYEFTMSKINEAAILDALRQPSDTTDTVKFETTDPKVITVDEITGKVLCVGPGKAEVRVTCGDMVATCRVTCEIEPEPTDPSEPPVNVVLMRKKIDNANYAGMFFNLFNAESSDVAADELTWISDDPKVATVDQSGKVTAVAEGSTTIRAEYQGVTVASCEIICNFTVPDNGEDPEGGDPGTGNTGSLVPYSHYGTALPFEKDSNAYSVTLSEARGEWVGLFLRDPNDPDNTVVVRWELDESYGGTCQLDEDGAGVTATSSETCRIVAKHENTYYYILIR